MSTRSAWAATAEAPELPTLRADEACDVVVVGAGIAGVTTAYLLARDGRSVVLLDQDRPGRGMTGQTTAHLTVMQDRPFVMLEKKHGREAAIRVGQAHMEAVRFIGRVAEDHDIACDHARLDGYLVDTNGTLRGNDLVHEMNLLHEIGLEGTEPVSDGNAPHLAGGPGLRIPDQARMHALHYLYGLLQAARDKGVRAYQDTQVTQIEDGRVETQNGHTITTAKTVVTTHTPIAAKQLALKLSPYTTYVIGATVPKGSVADALTWDTEEPYHYVRIQPWQDDQDLVIIGGADHRTASPPKQGHRVAYRRLEAWGRNHLPMLDDVVLRWSGQVFDPVDGLPYIGRSPDHKGDTYIATGFSGNGTTNGTIAGILLSDLIAGRKSDWAPLFDPARMKGMAGKESLTHNMDAAKHLVVDRLKQEGPRDGSGLREEEGAVIAHGATHHAVYRHADGRLETHSAVCTHMGCIVHWNGDDKTFECPCHGSRFGTDGRVLSGPAVAPLKPVERSGEARTQRTSR